jgi:hypothetical protein
MQAQILPANIVGWPQSILADGALNTDHEPGSGEGTAVASATTVRNNTAGTAEMKTRAGMNSSATAGNPAAATPGGSEDNETSGVQAFAPTETGASPANQQPGWPHSIGAQAEATQQEPAASQHRTGSGTPLADTAKANGGSDQEIVAGSNAFVIQSSDATAVAEESNYDGTRQAPEETVARLAHRDRAGEAAQPATHAVLAQQAGAGVEASGLARVPAGTEGTVNAMAAHAGVMAGTAAGTPAGEMFAAIDAGTGVGTPGWIHAGGQTAEAGFEDPALGWVGVRADVSGGNVHAALIPSSADAAQTLSGHLAGLNAYLAEQHTPVATLTLATTGGGGIETSSSQSMQQGAGQNLGQDAERNTPAQSQSSSPPGTATIPAAAALGAEAESGKFDAVAYTGEMRGKHISVMA